MAYEGAISGNAAVDLANEPAIQGQGETGDEQQYVLNLPNDSDMYVLAQSGGNNCAGNCHDSSGSWCFRITGLQSFHTGSL